MRDSFGLPLAFFASGVAGLLFEVLWFRALGRVLGNTVWAAALVLTAFMLGIALGGLLAARWAQRIRRPARAFAAAEAIVALSGSLLVWGLPAVEIAIGHGLSPLAEHSTTVAALRLLLALAAMLIPTTAMGTTLALGVRILAHRDTARSLGILYAANTFGACIAPVVAEYQLIGALGLRGTALVAAGLDVLAAVLVLAWQQPTSARAAPPLPAARASASPARLLLAAACAGALALALEVIWFRLLILFAPGSDTTFAVMLTLLLAGIALGGALAPLLARLPLVWVTTGSSLAVVLGYLLASPLQGSGQAQLMRYAIPLMLPAAVFSGCLFTLLGAQLRADAENPQPAIGRLTSANTLGAGLGAGAAGFVLLPYLGIESSLFLMAAGYALLPVLLVERRAAWKSLWPAVAAAAGLLFFPFGWIEGHLAQAAFLYRLVDGSTVAKVIQGPTMTLQILRTDRFGEAASWRLLSDSYSMTGTNQYSLRYMQLFAWLPLALQPESRRALLISYGAGNTAQALLSAPGLTELTVVDVSPEMLAASRLIHGERDPLADPRVRLVLEDGRHYLRTRREQFDIITGEPPPPEVAGVVNLYTREYFMALKERLAPGGLATYWLPEAQLEPSGARAIIAAFCDVFPDCTLWAGTHRNWILMGGREFANRPGADRFARLWQHPATAASLTAAGFEHPAQLGATFLADAAQLRGWTSGTPMLTDDYPKRLAPVLRILQPKMDEYDAWLQPETARRHFESSRWIAAHWPVELYQKSPRYFHAQPALNASTFPDPVDNLPAVDRLLRDSDLRIPILWLLGSDVTEQQILDRRLAEGARPHDRPDYTYALGVRALAERDYAKAAELFGQVAEHQSERYGALAAYAMCRAGQRERAAAVRGARLLAPELRCWAGP